jgi:hypothetical protein
MIELNKEDLSSGKSSYLDKNWNVPTYFSKTCQYKMS